MMHGRGLETLKQLARHAAKKVLKAAFKYILKSLLATVGPLGALIIFILLFITAVFGVVSAGDFSGDTHTTKQDLEIIKQYRDTTNKVNPPAISFDRQEVNFYLPYGLVYAIDFHAQETDHGYNMGVQSRLDDIANSLKPINLQYKDDKIIVCGKDGCEVTPVKVLIHIETYDAIVNLTYVDETIVLPDGGIIIKPVLESINRKQDYTRLDQVIKKYTNLKEVKDLDRKMILETATGVMKQHEYFDWLLGGFGWSGWIGGVMPIDLPSEVSQWWPLIMKAAQETGVDPYLIAAVMTKESGGVNGSYSVAGAGGLMQIMPGTAAKFGVTDVNDPEQNILAGAKYLKELLDDYHGSVPLALAAYNWGIGNMQNHGIFTDSDLQAHYNELPLETQDYVRTVTMLYNDYKAKASESYVFPVEGDYYISQEFGNIQSDGKPHTGVDIASSNGQSGLPILAVTDGVITREPTSGNGGNQIWLHGDDGNDWYYAHLQDFVVSAGDHVTKGQVIGHMGSTGNSTGPHLHFSLWKNGQWVNPFSVIRP